MLACGQAKLLDQLRTYQVVGTPTLEDDTCTPIVDYEESVKHVVALLLVWLLHLCAENMLDDDASVCGRLLRNKNLAFLTLLIGIVLTVVFYIRSAHVASICHRYVCLLVGIVLLHMSPILALVALKSAATHGRSS
jgi:hypothetical protein